MPTRFILAALVLMIVCAVAVSHPHAQAALTTQNAYSGVSIGTSSAQVVAPASSYQLLDLVNVSATATVCCRLGSAVATISTTQCAAGEIPLAPLAHRVWETGFIPGDAVQCIASATATQMTIGVK